MHENQKSVLLVAMPYAGMVIPSIQLPVLEAACRRHGITVETQHAYLKAAELYGLHNYHSLIYPPNDSYTAQMGFSRYVFPEHWNSTQQKCKEFYVKQTQKHKDMQIFSFEEYLQHTEVFYHWVLDNLHWQNFDLIGFTLNYGQLLPSLAIAKKIKELSPEKQIILGGSRVVGELGKNILHAFPYIDYVVSGEGEEALVKLASLADPQSIPRLIYRTNKEITWNCSQEHVDLNASPFPSYDSFYQQLGSTTAELQQFFQYYGRLAVEISRGCWWNRCTFCNLNIQHPSYYEKPLERIVEEIQWLSDRYHMLSFQIISNTLPHTHYRALFEQLRQLGRDFSFFAEARAGRLQHDDYRLMKETGFNMIQTGIESFSAPYLKKMNKGTRVIDNIAALKYCQENGIQNSYNLLVRYPNEDPSDFEQTKKVVTLLQSFLDPPQLCEFRLLYGSPVYCHPKQFNIKEITNVPIDQLMFPPELLQQGIAFVYDFKRATPWNDSPWESLVEQWKKERNARIIEAAQKQTMNDSLVFYFVDGAGFLKIYDKRDPQNIRIYVLNALERDVFLSCTDVISLKELQQKFAHVPEFELVAILQSFEQSALVYVEDDCYVSLPLRSHIREIIQQEKEHSVDVTL